MKRYRSLFRLAISAVAWLNTLRGMLISAKRRRSCGEAAALLRQIVGVRLDDDLDSFVAGVNFDPHGAVFEIDFVPSARFAANNGMGHERACTVTEGVISSNLR